MEKTKEKILWLLKENKGLTLFELAEKIGISQKGIEWQINELKKQGTLKRIGPDKGGIGRLWDEFGELESLLSFVSLMSRRVERMENKNDLPEDYKMTELGLLPEGWRWVRLEEVCEIYQPQTITAKEILESGPYKVFGANGVIGYYDKYNHEDAEVLITCRGATCGTANFSEPKSWITGNAMVVKPKNNSVDKQCLFYILEHLDLKPAISGSAQPQITRASLSPFKISLPTLPEQKEIAGVLKEKMLQVDKLRATIEKQIETINALPQAILRKAFRGKL